MKPEFYVGDVVQFTEEHKWCGCLGIVNEVKQFDDDARLMIGVPIPEQGTAYIFSMVSDGHVEYIGDAIMVMAYQEEDEE